MSPFTFLLILFLSQHAISYITFSESNDTCSLEIPIVISVDTVQTRRYDDGNVLLSCNVAGRPDFPCFRSNSNMDDPFITINIPYRQMLAAFLSITVVLLLDLDVSLLL